MRFQILMAKFLLFHQVVRSYLRLTSQDDFFEAGLLETKILNLGTLGTEINQKRDEIYHLKQNSIQTHLDLLDNVFDLIWPIKKPSVSNLDLSELGFDLEKPNISSYYDLI
jgi:hypothetical protein